MDKISDLELVKAAAAGDRAAFADLAERYYDHVHALAWRWTGARALAEDITQDTMVKLARVLTTFRGDCAFSTFVHRIAYTMTIDHLRARAKTIPFAPAQMAGLIEAETGESPEDALMGEDLWRAVRALPDQQHDATLLVYAQDFSHAEAAQAMGCTEKTVSWHLHEARKRLKTQFQQAD